jgi:D-alanyl-lipoteichoic acid acyltransferase DltB (MBOAT superfamily)
VLSGPIQKSDCLLPQIKDPEEMDSNDYICGFLLFIWGIFLKTILSSRLAAAVTLVYGNVSEYSGMYCLAAAFIFSFYIYVDFSAYSDMAVGCARMLGFNIAPNFRGPFLSTSMSELWRRWHITLNSWFIENVYIPLGGSRHGRARKYLNVMIVFILSGAWHDATAGYLVWGALNGAIVVAEDAVRSIRKKNVAIIWLRRLAVFCIFSFVFIFFRMPTIAGANSLIVKIFTIRLNDIKDFMPTGLFSWNRNEMIITACMLLLFIVVQYLREIQTTKLVPKKWIENDGKGNSFFIKFRKVPALLQVIVLAVLVTACVFAYCGDTTQLNTAFLYYNF